MRASNATVKDRRIGVRDCGIRQAEGHHRGDSLLILTGLRLYEPNRHARKGAFMLKDYPAISSLGSVDYIMPDHPSFIKVRSGTHLNGFTIEILAANAEGKYSKDKGAVQVVNDRIYVHR